MNLLSVIVPIYNMERYLGECLDSLIRAIGTDCGSVEILLVDDGSTDGSGTICDRFAQENSNVRVFHKDNGGVSSARNMGLEHASGQYIAWVDPDDYVSDDWFACIKAAILESEPDVVVMDMCRFGNGKETEEVYGRPGGFVSKDVFQEDVIRDVRILSGLPNKVMKTELFNNVRFDTELKILEDYVAMPSILKAVQSVYYIPRRLYYYRQHQGSLLHQVTEERAFQSVQIALARAEKIEEKFRAAAATAVMNQILTFYENQFIFPDFCPTKEQRQFCKEYVQKNLWIVCKDKEISVMRKIKLLLLALGLH